MIAAFATRHCESYHGRHALVTGQARFFVAEALMRVTHMLAEQLATAATNARTYRQLDDISRLIWRAHAEGHLSDAAAQAAAEAAQARKNALRGGRPREALKLARARRRPVTPDKAASIARRRRLAASGAVPGPIAASFTVSELSTLSVIAREVQKRGRCELHIDAIAAMAGTCRTVVQSALRTARALGLVSVQERRRAGQRSLTNVVTVISAEWRQWLRLGGEGSEMKTPRINQLSELGTLDVCSLSVHAPHGKFTPRKDVKPCSSSTAPPP